MIRCQLWSWFVLILLVPMLYGTSIQSNFFVHCNEIIIGCSGPDNNDDTTPDWMTYYNHEILNPVLVTRLPLHRSLRILIKSFLFDITLHYIYGQYVYTQPAHLIHTPTVPRPLVLPHAADRSHPFQWLRTVAVVHSDDVRAYNTVFAQHRFAEDSLTVTFDVNHEALGLPQLQLPETVRELTVVAHLASDTLFLPRILNLRAITHLTLSGGRQFQYDLLETPPSLEYVCLQKVDLALPLRISPHVQTVVLLHCTVYGSHPVVVFDALRDIANLYILDCKMEVPCLRLAATRNRLGRVIIRQYRAQAPLNFCVIIDDHHPVCLRQYDDSIVVEWTSTGTNILTVRHDPMRKPMSVVFILVWLFNMLKYLFRFK